MPKLDSDSRTSQDSRTTRIPEQLGFSLWQLENESTCGDDAEVESSSPARARGPWGCWVPALPTKIPSEINPTSAAISPTVGANCRGGNTQMPRGRLILGPNGCLWIRGGIAWRSHTRRTHEEHEEQEQETKNTNTSTSTPRCTLLRGPREEVKPLLQH